MVAMLGKWLKNLAIDSCYSDEVIISRHFCIGMNPTSALQGDSSSPQFSHFWKCWKPETQSSVPEMVWRQSPVKWSGLPQTRHFFRFCWESRLEEELGGGWVAALLEKIWCGWRTLSRFLALWDWLGSASSVGFWRGCDLVVHALSFLSLRNWAVVSGCVGLRKGCARWKGDLVGFLRCVPANVIFRGWFNSAS
jgi:hypothetical protein